MSEDNIQYELFLEEQRNIDAIFGDTNFTISIPYTELDELLTEKNQVIIKSDYSCYCYDLEPRNSEYFIVCGDRLTIKYVLLELKKQNLCLECNHRFVEGFEPTKNSDIQFVLCCGS